MKKGCCFLTVFSILDTRTRTFQCHMLHKVWRLWLCVTLPCLPPFSPSTPSPPPSSCLKLHCRIFSIETSMEMSLCTFLCSSTLGIKILLVVSGSGCTFSSYQFRDCVSLIGASLCFSCLIFGGKISTICKSDTASGNFILIARTW